MRTCKEILEEVKLKQYQLGGYYNNPYTYNSQFNFLPSYILPEIGQIALDYKNDFKDNKKSGEQIKGERRDKLIGLGVNTLAGTLGAISNVNYNQNQLKRQQELQIPNYTQVPYDDRYNSGLTDYYQPNQVGGIPQRYKDLGFTKVDTPKRTPNASKSHAVVIKDDGDYRLIRFGQQGVSGSPKKEGESDSDRKRRESFKARHAENIAKGKTSAAWWSSKIKWQVAGIVDNQIITPITPKDILGYKDNSPYKNEPYLDINSNVISMLGVSKPLMAYPNNDEPVLMQPNQEYYFPNSTKVREVPVYQNGGININRENKGIFTEKAERNRMGVQQYANYVLSHKDDFNLKTRQQAQFSSNSRNFQHDAGGTVQGILQYHKSQVGEEIKYENQEDGLTGQYNYIDYSEDEKQNELDDQDFWKTIEDENNLMFTMSESLKEELRIRSRDREINLDIPNNIPQNLQGSSIAVRHNNPGNIKFGEFSKQYGAVKGEYSQREKDGTYYSYFPTIQAGLAAQRALLTSKNYRDLTVPQALSKWADGTYTNQKFINMFGNKKIKDLSEQELAMLQKEQIKNEDINLYKQIYK
jgi:hypothetical protein